MSWKRKKLPRPIFGIFSFCYEKKEFSNTAIHVSVYLCLLYICVVWCVCLLAMILAKIKWKDQKLFFRCCLSSVLFFFSFSSFTFHHQDILVRRYFLHRLVADRRFRIQSSSVESFIAHRWKLMEVLTCISTQRINEKKTDWAHC